MKQKTLSTFFSLLAIWLITLLTISMTPNLMAQGLGHCSDADDEHRVEWNDNDTSGTYSDPDGNSINSIFIKTGTSCIEYTTDTSDGDYTVSGIGTSTVTVSENGEVRDISHVEYVVTNDVEATPSPSPSASPSASPEASASPQPTESPEVTASPSPEPTSTPDTNDDDDDDDNDDDNDNNEDDNDDDNGQGGSEDNTAQFGSATASTEEKQGQVLGSDSLAETGSSQILVAQMVQILGGLIASAGVLKGAKKQ
jgi:hypothetical protein